MLVFCMENEQLLKKYLGATARNPRAVIPSHNRGDKYLKTD